MRHRLLSPGNKSCVIRAYLGRRNSTKSKTNINNLSLRNFPLCVDGTEDMDLDTEHFAKVMAEALAILHWEVGVDGNDIEFILGSTPEHFHLPSEDVVVDTNDMDDMVDLCRADFGHRSISMWIIDFNQ
jgi:hypothetical protein